MCGICGIVWKQKGSVEEETIRRVNRSMTHRGPDDEGYFTDGSTQLAMRRLSIIDIEGGHQPISSEDGRYTIVFNGEVYNFHEIRTELESHGHIFATRSDTEVVLHSFIRWGTKCLDRLRGMFALAIWDSSEKTLFCARDRLGIKPFLFVETPQWFGFASEVKALLQIPGCPRRFDHAALHHHLALGSLPTPMTLFKDIRALPPGYLAWYRRGEWKVEQYWDVTFNVNKSMSEEEAIEGLESHIQDAVSYRLVSDVPLGAFLSGGIDSSLVVAMMAGMVNKPVKTFSIGWGPEYSDFNETDHARAVAERYGTDHHEHTVSTDDLLAEMPQIVWHYDQPTPSAFQTYFVSKFTKSQGITVALSGLGGDEIAAGYSFFPSSAMQEKRWQNIGRVPAPLRRLLAGMASYPGFFGKVGRGAYGSLQSPGWRFRQHRLLENVEEQLRALYSPENASRSVDWHTDALIAKIIDSAPTNEFVNRLSYHELKRYMVDDPLTDTDRCSMAHSLEVRVPLIDHHVVEFAGTIPPAIKLNNGTSKYLLKRLAEKYISHETIYRRKMGFEFPMMHWIKGPLAPMLDSLLSREVVEARGIFSPDAIAAWRAEVDRKPTRGTAALLWNLAICELWCRLYIDCDSPAKPDMDLETLLSQAPVHSLVA